MITVKCGMEGLLYGLTASAMQMRGECLGKMRLQLGVVQHTSAFMNKVILGQRTSVGVASEAQCSVLRR
jgi:hypothetical protein